VVGALDINKNKNIKELLAGLTKEEIEHLSAHIKMNPSTGNEN
jgi:hypothetical protein